MAPSLDADEIALVQREDQIVGYGVQGDWLQVDVPGKGSGWMMKNTSDRMLLVPDTMAPYSAPTSVPVSPTRSQTSTKANKNGDDDDNDEKRKRSCVNFDP